MQLLARPKAVLDEYVPESADYDYQNPPLRSPILLTVIGGSLGGLGVVSGAVLWCLRKKEQMRNFAALKRLKRRNTRESDRVQLLTLTTVNLSKTVIHNQSYKFS